MRDRMHPVGVRLNSNAPSQMGGVLPPGEKSVSPARRVGSGSQLVFEELVGFPISGNERGEL